MKLLNAVIIAATLLPAQTFRGAISGSVTDRAGAAIGAAELKATNLTNGLIRTAISTVTGDFLLPELPSGAYAIEVSKDGFQAQRTERVEVPVSVTLTLRFTLNVSEQRTIVDVVDTTTVEASNSTLNTVVSPQQVQNLPLNGRDFLRLIRLAPGVTLFGPSAYSINGSRGRSNNFQIDGADNNDAWQNASAGNQGGVAAVPNTLVPIEAIEQFSIQTNSSSETGRNSGSGINLAIRSGTNELHGSLFYFNRNEALAANSPVVPAGSPKRKIRNNQYGVSLGGPILRNRTFFFTTWEGQRITVGNTLLATTPSDAWIRQTEGVLRDFGVPVNPVSRNLLSLWPASGRSGAAVANNYFSNADNDYLTDNAILKLDHQLTSKHSLSARYFGATGKQLAFSGSPYVEYFQVATSRLHNYSLVASSVLSPTMLNQLVAGVNYFKPTFNDNDRSADPAALGLNTGVTSPELRGAPTMNISGFAGIGPTQPQGRADVTWHLAENFYYTRGRHQLKLGSEVRRARLDVFNLINQRGTFSFDGSAGPWSAGAPEERARGAQLSPAQRALADFLGGYLGSNSAARIVRGELARDLRQNSWSLFVHDNWQVAPKLNLNFGIRYEYFGVLSDTRNSLTTFLPDRGIVDTGNGIDRLYPRDGNNFAPRVGFAYTPFRDGRTVVRGGYGIFYDVFQATYFVSNSIANGGASGVNANPGGADPVFTLTRNNFVLSPGEPIFGSVVPVPPYGVYSISQDLRLPYVQNFHVTVQRELGRRLTIQAGYVGSAGRKLPLTLNVNAPVPGTTGTAQSRRPYAQLYPTLGSINELQTVGNSSYQALQTMFSANRWKGLTARVTYTYSKSIDLGSDARFIIPANSYDLRRERGPSDYDMRHVFSAGVSYQVPVWRALPKRLTEGWELNAFVIANTGLPLDIRAGTNVSGSGDGADRVDFVGDPFANIPSRGSPTSEYFFNPSAFKQPAAGTFGNLGRNAITGPGFSTVEFSVFKTTRMTERIAAQLRAEVFNLFNRTNWANPGTSLAASTSFGLMTNTRSGGNAPGIGPGEPRSLQLALKLIF